MTNFRDFDTSYCDQIIKLETNFIKEFRMDPDKKYKDMLKENPYLSIQKPEDVSGVIDRYEHAKKDEACWQVKELFSYWLSKGRVFSSKLLKASLITIIICGTEKSGI